MKKKVLIITSLIAILVIGLFVLTGCGNNNEIAKTEVTIDGIEIKLNNEKTFHNLKFKYPENGKFTNEEEINNVIKVFQDDSEERLLATIVVTIRKNNNVEEYIKKMCNIDANYLQSETINGIKWYIYDYVTEKTKAQAFYCQDNQDVYVISFPQEDNQDIDITSFKTAFMNNTKFE